MPHAAAADELQQLAFAKRLACEVFRVVACSGHGRVMITAISDYGFWIFD
jgi:hypothetical protein